mmetsp:Transcript_14926/g.30705  ORF Transcript_14926/g.30705 Transcript_14926/m.30705 type:complete len:317 (+) Transcript_14926:1684-2634(+)
MERFGQAGLRSMNRNDWGGNFLQERPNIDVAQRSQAKLDSPVGRYRVVHRGVQVESQRGRDLGEVGRREDEPSVEINGQIRPCVGAAGEYVHAVVHDGSVVRINEREAVEVEERPQEWGLVVSSKETCNGGTVSVPHKVVRLLSIELPSPVRPDVLQELIQAACMVIIVQSLSFPKVSEGLSWIVPKEDLNSGVSKNDVLENDFQPLAGVKNVVAYNHVEHLGTSILCPVLSTIQHNVRKLCVGVVLDYAALAIIFFGERSRQGHGVCHHGRASIVSLNCPHSTRNEGPRLDPSLRSVRGLKFTACVPLRDFSSSF